MTGRDRMESEELERELEKLHRASFGWALACCGQDRDEAEDVLQAAYERILDGRARFRGDSSFKTWWFAVIRRTASGARRQNGLRRLLLGRWSARVPALSPNPGPDRVLEASQQQVQLLSALESLFRRQREVLQLVFYHGLTIEEASRVMGVSLGSARVHYARGKAQLLRMLQGGEGP